MTNNSALKGGHALGIVTPDMHKRAALLFDKVFLVRFETGPRKVPIKYADSRFDWVIQGMTLLPNFPIRPSRNQEQALIRGLGKAAEVLCKIGSEYADYDVVPMYAGGEDSFPKGTTLAYQASFRAIPEVLEKQATFDQIIEFRSDSDAARKYRDLRVWLRDTLTARSVAEAEDIIQRRLEDYKEALKKHGLKTAQGCIKILYDDKFLARAAAVASGAGILGGPVGAVLAAGIYVGGKVFLELTERRIESIDGRTDRRSEVAVIYEARKLIKK